MKAKSNSNRYLFRRCDGAGTGLGILASIITMWFSVTVSFHADAGSGEAG